MEIVFNKLSYVENKMSSSPKNYLDNVSLEIKQGSIIAFIGENISIIGKLLMVIKRPSKGELKLDNIVVKRTSHINNINLLRKKMAFMIDDNFNFITDNVKSEIETVMKNYNYHTKDVNKHIVDSLKIVGLSEDYLDRDPNELSYTEKKKVNLACMLSYNPEVIILENFEKGLIARERTYFKNLFLKLKNKFNKTIILLTKDITFMFGIVDNLNVINNAKIVISGDADTFYENKLYKYIEMPKIVEFTKYVQEQGHNILEYVDIKELIKEIYRNVK